MLPILHVLVSVESDGCVGHGARDARVGAHESKDVAARLAPDGSLVEGVDDEDGRLEHHDEVQDGQVDDEHVGGSPQALGADPRTRTHVRAYIQKHQGNRHMSRQTYMTFVS